MREEREKEYGKKLNMAVRRKKKERKEKEKEERKKRTP